MYQVVHGANLLPKFFVIINSMPNWTFIVNRLSLIRKNLLFTIYYLLFTIFLTGCSAIGYTKPAALQVTSEPEASVFLDGKHLGKTPFYSDQFQNGEALLKISASDAKFITKVKLTEGTLAVVNRELSTDVLSQAGETLTLTPNSQGFMIITDPNEANVTIDGRYSGKTPKLASDLANGDHKVLVSKKGYVSREFAIKTSSKYQVVAEVTLASEIAKSSKGSKREATQEAR